MVSQTIQVKSGEKRDKNLNLACISEAGYIEIKVLCDGESTAESQLKLSRWSRVLYY